MKIPAQVALSRTQAYLIYNADSPVRFYFDPVFPPGNVTEAVSQKIWYPNNIKIIAGDVQSPAA